jgi:hypothetical protein
MTTPTFAKMMKRVGLKCHYCALDGIENPAHITMHDGRGCLHVCVEHAKWRLTKAWMFGHSSDCPFNTKK